MKRKIIFFTLVTVVTGIGLLHLFTPVEMVFYHQTYRRLSYFPIVLGGMWFGAWGGLLLGALASIAFLPHVLLFAGENISSYFNELSEIILYIAAGGVVGFIAGRERMLRRRYQDLSIQLEKSYEALEQGTKELVEAEEQLAAAQKLSAIGEMAANLAHEVKNPLASIKGTTEILLDDYPEGHRKREFVEILLKETERLNYTVDEVLGRAHSQKIMSEQAVALIDLLEELKVQMFRLFNRGDIQFDLTGVAVARRVIVPELKFKQVLLNLLVNCFEALENRSEEQGRVEINTIDCDGNYYIKIDDNGPGLPADRNIEEFFKPFYSTTPGGTGLGLSISRKIIERYGGTLTIVGSSLGGACFQIKYPEKFSLLLNEKLIGNRPLK